jgi:hypothetical protein
MQGKNQDIRADLPQLAALRQGVIEFIPTQLVEKDRTIGRRPEKNCRMRPLQVE